MEKSDASDIETSAEESMPFLCESCNNIHTYYQFSLYFTISKQFRAKYRKRGRKRTMKKEMTLEMILRTTMFKVPLEFVLGQRKPKSRVAVERIIPE